MIFLGIGGNLPFNGMAVPATQNAALDAMAAYGISVQQRSSLYHSKPVPASDQPWFYNAVVSCTSHQSAEECLRALLTIEEKFGRVRSEKNAARTLDLDIIDFNGQIISNSVLELPHPRLTSRAFILLPLLEIAPAWKHPVSGVSIADLANALTIDDRLNTVKI